MKRKRVSCVKDDAATTPQCKRLQIESAPTKCSSSSTHTHPVLCRYYQRVLPLRAYLLGILPHTSRKRRRILEKFPRPASCGAVDELRSRVAQLLDNVLVGCWEQSHPNVDNDASQTRFEELSQSLSSFNNRLTFAKGKSMFWNDLIDFCIWLLFNRSRPTSWRSPHMLCHGLQRTKATFQQAGGISGGGGCGIPGLVSVFPNEYVEAMKSPAWAEIPRLLGDSGDQLMIDLVLRCGLFAPVASIEGGYYQISGTPMCDLPLWHPPSAKPIPDVHHGDGLDTLQRNPGDIRFVRNRMFYAKAAINGKGKVFLGLRHIHVLNRFPDPNEPLHTAHVMKYIFPRQFRLHNVFTSNTDKTDTVQSFKDYTLREQEIAQASLSGSVRKQRASDSAGSKHISLPRRLRGEAFLLTRRMQKLHCACSYVELLDYYCPLLHVGRFEGDLCFTSFATPHDQVSAFCRAVIAKVLPQGFLGKDKIGDSNRAVLSQNIDAFVRARRYETLTLEHVMQRIKTHQISWTASRSTDGNRVALCESLKRKELMMELIYYVFDSLITPLIRSNFHVTESNSHRNRLFYFRHDIWKRLAEPAIGKLKSENFEEMHTKSTLEFFSKRSLGFSQLRLLPKAKGVRPIANLRRRMQITLCGRQRLTQSINHALAPVFNVLNYERFHQPQRLGGSIFSPGDAHTKVHDFRASLRAQGLGKSKLYFVKVDVRSCFDSIPQKRLLDLVQALLSADNYYIGSRAELKPPLMHNSAVGARIAKPRKSIIRQAGVTGQYESFPQTLEDVKCVQKQHTVFVDNVAQTLVDRNQLVKLLDEHVQNNIVKIGKKFYKQRTGIAQGSVLSTMLCSFLYADFESKRLSFLSNPHCLLLRLVDDFLLITTNRGCALRFLEVMRDGDADYGVATKTEKSLVNFDTEPGAAHVPQVGPMMAFPYCGLLIDTRTLELSRDTCAQPGQPMDALTVEYSKNPGHKFRRKVLDKIKRGMQTTLLDTTYNRLQSSLKNIFQTLCDAALICLHYMRGIARLQKPGVSVLLKTVSDAGNLAFALTQSKRNKHRFPDYECNVTLRTIRWLTYQAFVRVFAPKQTQFADLLGSLKSDIKKTAPLPSERVLLEQVLIMS